jgi:competence protein ComEC
LAAGLASSASRPAATVLVLAVPLALAALGSPRAALLATAAVVVGVAAGSARIASADATASRALSVPRADGRAVVLERPRRTRFGSWAVVELRSGAAQGARVVARAGEGMHWPRGGEPGTQVALSGALERPRNLPVGGAGRAAGSQGRPFDWVAHLRRRGIAAELQLDSLRPTGRRRAGVSGAVDVLRKRAEAGLSAGMDRERAAVARGMVLGQDEDVDPLVVDDFRASGLGHLLAVSGQNVALLCALALPLLAAAGLRTRGRVAALAALIALYVPLAGAGPSLQRAAAMGVAGLAALALGRVASRWYALLLAAAATLAVNPLVAAEPGWQLSFAAVAGILLLAPPLQRPLRGLPRPLAAGAAMTVAATLATAPLAAYHFGAFSPVGLVANLVALPLVAPIVWLGLVQAALGMAGGAVLLAMAGLLGRVDGALIGALVRVATDFAGMPGARVRVPITTPAHVIVAYAVPGAAYLAARARTPRR